MHAEVLNFMLANTCHNEKVMPGETHFTFDLHCVEVTVIAKFIGTWGQGDEPDDIQYEILSWTSKEI